MGTVDSSTVFSVPLLPLLSAAQAAGVRVWGLESGRSRVSWHASSSWDPGANSPVFISVTRLSGVKIDGIRGGGAKGGPLACKEPKDYHRNQPV